VAERPALAGEAGAPGSSSRTPAYGRTPVICSTRSQRTRRGRVGQFPRRRWCAPFWGNSANARSRATPVRLLVLTGMENRRRKKGASRGALRVSACLGGSAARRVGLEPTTLRLTGRAAGDSSGSRHRFKPSEVPSGRSDHVSGVPNEVPNSPDGQSSVLGLGVGSG